MAEEDAKVESSGSGETAPAKNHLLTILLILNAALMAGVAYMQYSAHEREAAKPALTDVIKAEIKKSELAKEEDTGEAKEEEGINFELKNFTANLAQGDGPRRFLRMGAVLKFSKDSSEEEFKARRPQIRDTIISMLNTKRPEDLLKPEGKKFLKEEIKSSINSFLVDGHVIDVFYTGFQIN